VRCKTHSQNVAHCCDGYRHVMSFIHPNVKLQLLLKKDTGVHNKILAMTTSLLKFTVAILHQKKAKKDGA
jgi:hypothetical protein